MFGPAEQSALRRECRGSKYLPPVGKHRLMAEGESDVAYHLTFIDSVGLD